MAKRPYQIDVDLDVFKALTNLMQTEGQEHNDVIRELLNLDSPTEPDIPDQQIEALGVLARFSYPGQFYSRGLALPNGTKLKARYKGVQYLAEIQDGCWRSENGAEHSSPSSAATAITQTAVNGLRFWDGMLPGDRGWRSLEAIRNSQASRNR